MNAETIAVLAGLALIGVGLVALTVHGYRIERREVARLRGDCAAAERARARATAPPDHDDGPPPPGPGPQPEGNDR